MNQEKIGKLIAKLRREKNLTQRELGEMVGVGYRAVSKWETGLTMPDISIINELSTILGISSDELLKGELKDSKNQPNEIITKQKSNNKLRLLLLLIPMMLIVVVTIMIINNREKVIVYTINSKNPSEYKVDGTLTIKGNNMIININKIEFQDYNFSRNIIKDYEYNITLDDCFIFGTNKGNEYTNTNTNMTIKKFSKNFTIVYYNNTFIKEYKKIKNGNLNIELKFYKEDESIINKNIKMILVNK